MCAITNIKQFEWKNKNKAVELDLIFFSTRFYVHNAPEI